MKKISITLLLAAVSAIWTLTSADSYRLPSLCDTWNMLGISDYDGNNHYRSFILQLTTDTVIDGKLYVKLEEKSYLGALREENNNGDAVVSLTMINPMSAGSLLKPSISGYSKFWRDNKISSKFSGYFNSEANTSGMMHTVNMTMTWTTTIKNPSKQ